MTNIPATTGVTQTPPAPAWTHWNTIALLAIVVAIGVLGVATPGIHLSQLASWLLTMALFVAFLVVVGYGVTGRPQGLLIDERKKMSLSRLQMVLWTVVILSGLLTAALSNIGLLIEARSDFSVLKLLQAAVPQPAQGAPSPFEPLAIVISTQVWLLMGISTTSLVGSPLLKSNKMREGKIKIRDDVADAEVADLFRGEEPSNCDVLDLAKVQMFFFTLVLVLSYAVLLGSLFSGATNPITRLPDVDGSMVTLLGISHAGYLANKAAPHPAAPTQTPPPPQPAG